MNFDKNDFRICQNKDLFRLSFLDNISFCRFLCLVYHDGCSKMLVLQPAFLREFYMHKIDPG